MDFESCNRFLKIQESIGTPTPKMGVHLWVWRFNSHILSYFQPFRSMKCDSRTSLLVVPLQAFTLVVSPRLGLRHLCLHGWKLIVILLLLSLQQVDEIIYDDLKHILIDVMVFFNGHKKQTRLIKLITFEINVVNLF